MRQRVAALPPNSAVFYHMFAVGSGRRAARGRAGAPRHPGGVERTGLRHVHRPARRGHRRRAARRLARHRQRDGGAGRAACWRASTATDGNRCRAQCRRRRSTGASSSAGAFRSRGCRPEPRCASGRPRCGSSTGCLILAGDGDRRAAGRLIAALLFQRARRRNAEKEAAGLSGRLLTAHEDERRRLARELHDDLTQRLARLAIDAGRLERGAGARRVGHAPGPGAPERGRACAVVPAAPVGARRPRAGGGAAGRVRSCGAPRRPARGGRGARRARGGAQRGVAVPLPHRAGGAEQCRAPWPRERRDRAAVAARPAACSSRSATTAAASTPARSRERASLGLASMRERVRLLRGQLDIESTPGTRHHGGRVGAGMTSMASPASCWPTTTAWSPRD